MTLLPPSSRSEAVRSFQKAGLESTARRDLAGGAVGGGGQKQSWSQGGARKFCKAPGWLHPFPAWNSKG